MVKIDVFRIVRRISTIRCKLEALLEAIDIGFAKRLDDVCEVVKAEFVTKGESLVVVCDDVVNFFRDKHQASKTSMAGLIIAYMKVLVNEINGAGAHKKSAKLYLEIALRLSDALKECIEQDTSYFFAMDKLLVACGWYDDGRGEKVVESLLANPEFSFHEIRTPLLPWEIDALQRGMNKRRVSVGEIECIEKEMEELAELQSWTVDQTNRLISLRKEHIRLSGSNEAALKRWTSNARIGHLSDETPEREVA